MTTKATLMGLAWCQAAALAVAQAPAAIPATDPAAVPPFVCGGIGDAEQAQMKQMASQHDLMLTFASQTGDYLSGVEVQIARTGGELVARGTCNGPMLLMQLPGAGGYEVTANYRGQVQKKSVTPGRARPARLVFRWQN